MATDCPEIRNWSGNIPPYTPRICYRPKGEKEVLEILDRHRNDRVRVIGSGHSMNEIAKSTDVSIDMSDFDDNPEGFIGAGVTLEALQETLASRGMTLPARGTIKLQTIAGAISTGTHGSGRSGLSHYVDAVRVAAYDAAGNAKVFAFESGEELRAARTALGAMGVILGIRLREAPAYFIEQSLVRADDIGSVLERDEAGALRYPLQLFIRIPYEWSYLISRRRESPRGPQGVWENLKRYARRLKNEWGNDRFLPWVIRNFVAPRSPDFIQRFYRSYLPRLVSEQEPVIDDDDHVQTMRHDLFPNQDIELFVPESRLQEADEWLKQMISAFADPGYRPPQQIVDALQGVNLHDAFVSRTPYALHAPIFYQRVLADDTMISMTAGREPFYSILLLSYLPERKDGFEPFAEFIGKGFVRLFHARLHWGKIFPLALAPENASSYLELERFRQLCRTHDPKGVFRNDFTARVLGL
jgi:L-gulono-1,4-lactone dehydrogenase